jgi:hypothetical protein
VSDFPLTLADSIVAGTALAGTLAAMGVIRARATPDGLATRFTFALSLVAGILASRLLTWHLHAEIFDTIGRIFAAWISLAALVVIEGLLRRHAPEWAKWIALVGGGVCSVLAFFPAALGFPNYILLALQLATFLGVYWLALTRNRDDLTAGESGVLVRMRVALPILLVCVISDYGLSADWVPIRASGIAILFFCWMAIGPMGATAGRREAALMLFLTTLFAVLVGLAAGRMASLGIAFGVQVAVMTLCAGILVLVLNEAVRAFAQSRRDDVLKALTLADTKDVRSFIASVAAGTQLQGTEIIDSEALKDFDLAALGAAFGKEPVMDRGDLEHRADDVRQQLDSLFVTYDATHLMALSSNPLLLAAATLSTVGSTAALKTELALVQRMATLVSRQETDA